MLGFNDTSTVVGHLCCLPEKGRSRGDENEGQGRKRNRHESEETEEIKFVADDILNFPLIYLFIYLFFFLK